MLAAHDGPETGEDGPTHHGLFWMSLYTAYPGIKVYKPLDANEAIEMLFHAAQRGEPVVFSATRPGTPVLKRGDGVPPAREAINGAYVFKPFRENGKPKKVLAICGGQVMAQRAGDPAGDRGAVRRQDCGRDLAAALRRIEADRSRRRRTRFCPTKNGSTWWRCTTDGRGFLYPFVLPADYQQPRLRHGRVLQVGKAGRDLPQRRLRSSRSAPQTDRVPEVGQWGRLPTCRPIVNRPSLLESSACPNYRCRYPARSPEATLPWDPS